ncbi:glycosyltransferase, partial [Robiginitalea sp.]|uniref:glycosyltransferase n=1 Tax=Robiginitalea sp. TaxID=1902411 RepID=UPI003C3D2989
MTELSIIIPTLNEAPRLEVLLPYLRKNLPAGAGAEIIVADGGSSDGTPEIARRLGAEVLSTPKGRAVQMNEGAKNARGRILYFLHADSVPPPGFYSDILNALKIKPTAGCFR